MALAQALIQREVMQLKCVSVPRYFRMSIFS